MKKKKTGTKNSKKNYKIHTITNIPQKLIELLTQTTGEEKPSTAIKIALCEMLATKSEDINKILVKKYCIDVINIDIKKLNYIFVQNHNVRIDVVRINIRLNPDIISALNNKFQASDLNIYVYFAIIIYLNHHVPIPVPPLTSGLPQQPAEKDIGNLFLKTLNVIGNKRHPLMIAAIKNILKSSILCINTSIEVCAGALGIFANNRIAKKEILNDNDIDKINFYKCLQKDAAKLMIKCMTYAVSKKTFKEIKSSYKERKINAKKIDFDAAAEFFFLNITSFRNTGDTYNSTVKPHSYYNRCGNIYGLGNRLKNATIESKDLIKQVKRHQNEPHTLIIVDPPYLDTDYYNKGKEKKFDWKKHQQLARELKKIQGYFIYFCRVTSPHKKNREGKYILTEKEMYINDCILKGKIEDMFCDCGFFYIDIPIKKDVTERIITNFPFKEAKKFVS